MLLEHLNMTMRTNWGAPRAEKSTPCIMPPTIQDAYTERGELHLERFHEESLIEKKKIKYMVGGIKTHMSSLQSHSYFQRVIQPDSQYL